MSNLMITIMAIGLAAVVTVAGMYYGGGAFQASFYKSQATNIVSYLDGYTKAIIMWSQRNGGTLPEPAKNYPLSGVGVTAFSKTNLDSFLVPRFMQTNTIPIKLVASNNFLYWNESSNLMQNPILVGFLGPNDVQVCNAIEAMRTNVWPNSLRTYIGVITSFNANFCGAFGCIINNGAWGSTSTNAYVIYYRVHGRVNLNFADVDPKTCT